MASSRKASQTVRHETVAAQHKKIDVGGVQNGEIARRGRTLAFVEVKARSSDEAAGFALDEWRLRRVVVAAERLAPRYMRHGDDVRIDAIFLVRGRWPRHLANVWQGR